jgi:hypothetical protein
MIEGICDKFKAGGAKHDMHEQSLRGTALQQVQNCSKCRNQNFVYWASENPHMSVDKASVYWDPVSGVDCSAED